MRINGERWKMYFKWPSLSKKLLNIQTPIDTVKDFKFFRHYTCSSMYCTQYKLEKKQRKSKYSKFFLFNLLVVKPIPCLYLLQFQPFNIRSMVLAYNTIVYIIPIKHEFYNTEIPIRITFFINFTFFSYAWWVIHPVSLWKI